MTRGGRVRPLDFLGSIKLKLGIVIVVAVAAATAATAIGRHYGLPAVLAGLIAGVLAVALVQLLAHGMTFPLREMVAAARGMARGDYTQRVTATSHDEVGELARAFNTMAGELELVDRFRRDLVANASHELRTPLGALKARLENLVDGVEQPTPETLDGMLRQVDRLGALVSQLLDLSKLESGSVPLERVTVDPHALLDRVATEWREPAAARSVRIDVTRPAVALAITADPQRLHQVVNNLVANAVRHAPAGGCVVLTAESAGDHARIEVVDDGPGIDPDDAERVFERFYRSDRARTSDEGGAGLGLAIARWIVELHGGTIRADRRIPHGCRMVVELPR
jgi:signal transduction histidine kinase